mmetsp:Transcript_27154/g.46505  ORF Transcript_27154/g.46505 Transcript_27154/m.46505 type:complete len:814 (+) Transcript_27154:29-2470(+)
MSSTKSENAALLTSVLVGGIGVAVAVYLLKQKYSKPNKSAIQLFNSGTPDRNAIKEACKQIREGTFLIGNNDENVLHLACRYGNDDAVKELLPLFSSHNLALLNCHGCNILHLCTAETDNVSTLDIVLNYLLEKNYTKLLQDLLLQKTYSDLWTPFHLAASRGNIGCMKRFFELDGFDFPINEKDKGGHVPLVMSSANGHLECVRALLNQSSINIYLSNTRCKTCLYFASFNLLEDIVKEILEFEKQQDNEYTNRLSTEGRKLVDICDFSGNSPLHAACLKGSLSMVKLLQSYGANIITSSMSGDSCIHLCCQRNSEKHNELLRYLINSSTDEDIKKAIISSTAFGCTPLHDAAYCGNWKALQFLREGREELFLKSLESIDNDGLTPILSLCRGIVTYKAKKFNSDDLLKTLEFLLSIGCKPNGGDFAKSTCLHFLCYGIPDDDVVVKAINILLNYNADPSLEDSFGWSPLHAVYQCKHDTAEKVYSILENYLKENNSDYLIQFDKNKPRDNSDRTFVEKAGPHNRIPISERKAVLNGDFTVSGIANYIKKHLEKNPSMKIVALVGAGISVNCGIPDFRSPESGIYSKISPGQFSMEFLATQPQEFYNFVRETFGFVIDKKVKPSSTHYFLKLLADKGLLHRLYTQNIDNIEKLAGIDDSLIVEAHGSFGSARCASCMKPVEDMENGFWGPIRDSEIPSCKQCGEIIRPDVVFFGENLPGKFFELHQNDLKDADLLIVMGTSLVVYPFASLVGMVPLLTPRLLINKKRVGPFTKSIGIYRDAVFEGDCDEGVIQLATELGWKDELDNLKNSSE